MSNYLEGKHVVDPVLINIAHGYKNVAFTDERIFPVVLTNKEGVRVPTFGKTTFVEYDTERTVGANSNVLVHEKTSTLDLVLGEHDLAAPVDYREQVESMFSEESKAIRRATNDVNLHRELIAACLAQDEKVYCTGHAKKLIANDHWADGKGDPIGVIEAGMETVRTATGLRPNLIAAGAGVMALLKFHPAIQAAIRADKRKRITTEILQDLFQIEEIIIGASVSLLSAEAAVDKNSVPADTWRDNLMLHYVDRPQLGANSADENEPSFGYILYRKGMPITDKYNGADGRMKYCRYTDIYKVAVVSSNAGHLITGISK